MSYYDIILLAIALSVDVMVVSFSYGLCIEKRRRLSAFILALTTGLFHMFMPVLGYFFTDIVRVFIQPYSKFIVFLIFMYLGGNFIIEALKNDEPKKMCIDLKSLILIGIATSIDVFSAGISLSLTSSPMRFSIAVLGLITFSNSLVGFLLGSRLKIFNSKVLEIIGGIILIGLAVKTFF
jgi:putative Mn2+ efflux pump MntP